MTSMNPNSEFDPIRITKEDAFDPHVDSMLKRQMSLRGETGIARDRSKKWYYSNWFVFMIAGAVAAFIAWAILEPYIGDTHYVQGPVEEMDLNDSTKEIQVTDKAGVSFLAPVHGWIRVHNEKIWLTERSRYRDAKGKSAPLADQLAQGANVGVYAWYFSGGESPVALVAVAEQDPPKQKASEAAFSLRQLEERSHLVSQFFFALIAACIGLLIGAVDGVVTRQWRRALLCGAVGLVVGFLGGLMSGWVAGIVYMPISRWAEVHHGTSSFMAQMGGRGLAWCLAGVAMGLAQGLALRSGRLLLYGFIGGLVGGLTGGLLFDPIDALIPSADKTSAWASRLVGIVVIGASVGAIIGIVELIARDAWLRMVEGPLAGKEFLLFRDTMNVGSSPRSDLYLFNDKEVAERHAVIRTIGEECEIESTSDVRATCVNGRPVKRARLRHGDQVSMGRTVFVFQKRQGS